ncbi:MAG: hypothetical protein ACLR07_15710 [Christensenellales bacterium]
MPMTCAVDTRSDIRRSSTRSWSRQASDEPDAYQVGDTVYLGNTAFLIEEITDTHVNLRDPTLLYPISRVERRDNV